MTPEPLSDLSKPDFSADELLVLTRAMAGIFLDSDAPLRMDILRKLAKAEMAKRAASSLRDRERAAPRPDQSRFRGSVVIDEEEQR